MSLSLIFISLMIFFITIANIECACWKDSFVRETATLSTCSDDYEKNGALCYPKCKEGFYGVGPVCWELCKEGYDDHGVSCFKNAHIYAKECCCTIFTLNCCNNCTEGYKDDGCTCRRDVQVYFKQNYPRSPGIPLSCTIDQEQSGALCYPKCSPGFYGLGPVCWHKCQEVNSFDCGLFCASDIDDCSAANRKMLNPILTIVFFYNNKCDFSKSLKETTRIVPSDTTTRTSIDKNQTILKD